MIRVMLVGDIDNVRRQVIGGTAERMQQLADEIVDRARELCPVRTGRLRDSIMAARESPLRYVVVAGAPYAGYVEYGTRRTSPRPFMRPAVTAALRML